MKKVVPSGASMEPCLFRHGKTLWPAFLQRGDPQLQWSHVFSDMVRAVALEDGARPLAASMEPCLFRHGKVDVDAGEVRVGVASMEPCLFRHGKSLRPAGRRRSGSRFNGAMSFQTW